MDRKKIEGLISKYIDGTCSPEEKSLVEQWYNHAIDEQDRVILSSDLDEIGDKIFRKLPVKKKSRGNIFYRSVIAATVLILILFASKGLFHDKQSHVALNNKPRTIVPGGNRAYLTLEDGSRIPLDNVGSEETFQQKGALISKTEDGQLLYSMDESLSRFHDNEISYNTISTPRGGQYKILLPDGTKVWLNAESSLTYPTTFASLNKRRVELQGEAYFEVKPNEIPFLVHSILSEGAQTQDVEVLGTHFNINAYRDANVIRTTLVEGSVRIIAAGQEVVLKPNQQSALEEEGALKTLNVDSEIAIAWKNGYFMFSDDRIEDIMLRIGRWYDVDIEFQHVDKTQVFSGTVSKFENVESVLNLLELTGGVHFEIQGKKIIVN